MSDNFKYIEFYLDKEIGRITLNRPPLNVLNIDMLNEIIKALKNAQEINDLKLLIIDAKGKAFSGGLDIKDHSTEKIEKLIPIFHRVFFILKNFKIPTMAVVNGEGAFGGGCELATFCDIVLASENAKFAHPEIKVGIIAPIGITLLPKLIGRHVYEMLLTGKEYKAPQAAQIGLISRAVPDDKLETEVNNVIKRITSNSSIVIKMTRQAIAKTIDMKIEDGLKEVEKIYTKSLLRTFDAREGLNAFLEKRKPQWKNK